ncbi:outer membrane porin GjpA [Mycobacterium alsense]|nr:outer membrane porin GjpA [Mycobacterium alsense]
MSFVIAVPELVQGAAQDLAGLGSSLAEAAARVAGPTTGIAAAAHDEVSVAIASLFGGVGQEFQALGAQARAFHAQFVEVLNASAGAYVSAEVANAQQTLGAVAAPAQVTELLGPWQQVLTTTTGNAQTVFAASQQALTTLSGGIAVEFGQLLTSPATAFGNLRNALQSVALIGNPNDVSFQNLSSAVTQHTLGGTTVATPGILFNGQPVQINDIHYQILLGLLGSGFTPGTGMQAGLVGALANFAASPLSGVLIGFAGPIVSPGVQLLNNAGAIATDLTGGNPAAALTELINTPADLTNAFFNGATLNLDPLAPVINPFVSAGDAGGQTLTGLSIAFGGLFSPGQVAFGANGPMYNGTGGSLLNSLGMGFSFSPPDDDAGATIAFPGLPVGPIGAVANLIDIFGQQLAGNLITSPDVAGYGPI